MATAKSRIPSAPAYLSDAQVQAATNLYKLASDPTRLKILDFLVDGEQHVTAICEHLEQSQPAISHHIALLRVSGILESRREGKHNFYSLTASGRELVGLAARLGEGE